MTASKRTMDYWHRVDLRVLVEPKLGRLPRAADWVPPEDQQQVQCVRLCIRLSLSLSFSSCCARSVLISFLALHLSFTTDCVRCVGVAASPSERSLGGGQQCRQQRGLRGLWRQSAQWRSLNTGRTGGTVEGGEVERSGCRLALKSLRAIHHCQRDLSTLEARSVSAFSTLVGSRSCHVRPAKNALGWSLPSSRLETKLKTKTTGERNYLSIEIHLKNY